MTHFLIRPAEEPEAPLLLGLIQELAEAEAFPFPITVTEKDLCSSLFCPQPAAETALGFEDDKLVGFAVFYETFATTTGRRGMHIDDLFVRPEFQGKGYGRAFLGYVAKIAKERGCARFEWWALKTIINAIGFFQSIGARPMEELIIFRTQGSNIDKF